MNFPISFRPKLVDTLKDYSAQKFYADAIAGFTVGIVALPLRSLTSFGSNANNAQCFRDCFWKVTTFAFQNERFE
jgi:hypothetical protein